MTQSACTLAHQLARPLKWRNAGDRPQHTSVGTLETLDRYFASGAVHPPIGDITNPGFKVGFQCRPALKPPSGDRVLLHITDGTLIFPLGACPGGGTRVRA